MPILTAETAVVGKVYEHVALNGSAYQIVSKNSDNNTCNVVFFDGRNPGTHIFQNLSYSKLFSEPVE